MHAHLPRREAHGRQLRNDRKFKLGDGQQAPSALEDGPGRASIHLVRFVGVTLAAKLRRLIRHGIGVVGIVGSAQKEHG